ncbi:unnamed protein product [Rotaria magnacalcarata]
MATSSSRNTSQEVTVDAGDQRSVKLVYDTWTPRPHFVVVQYRPQQNASPEEFEATYKLVGSFLAAKPEYNKEAILSFHRGKWYQQNTGHWHAHLCVPMVPYMNAAKTQISPTNNKEWDNARTVEDGMRAWDRKKREQYKKYQLGCVNKKYARNSSVESYSLSNLDANSNEFKLAWISSAPRIGVIALNPDNTTLASLYNFMSEVRVKATAELNRHDPTFNDFGCHLCLYVSGKTSDTKVTSRSGQVLRETGDLTENTNLVGYIQMDESQYAQWLPTAIREQWLTQFADSEHFVST